MKRNDIINFYDNIYDEESRLSGDCDNRHIVEREVKMSIYKAILGYCPKGIKILDISCGTGLYSIELAKLGYEVYACDLCEKHINILNEKAIELGLNIKTYICDACSLPFGNNFFDFVLLAGAIYHLDPEDKIKAINEAVRVCRENKHILIDFLPRLHAIYQNVVRFRDSSLDVHDIFFSYDSKEDMKSYINREKVYLNGFFSTDGITRFISNSINLMTKDQLNRYIHFRLKEASNEEMVDISEHAIMDLVKNQII